VYVPALRPAGETNTESVEGAVPDVDANDSQEAFVVALQVSVPPPEFATVRDCAVGYKPPTVYENRSWAEESEMVGGRDGAATTVSIAS
jgi:hypothetical protein